MAQPRVTKQAVLRLIKDRENALRSRAQKQQKAGQEQHKYEKWAAFQLSMLYQDVQKMQEVD